MYDLRLLTRRRESLQSVRDVSHARCTRYRPTRDTRFRSRVSIRTVESGRDREGDLYPTRSRSGRFCRRLRELVDRSFDLKPFVIGIAQPANKCCLVTRRVSSLSLSLSLCVSVSVGTNRVPSAPPDSWKRNRAPCSSNNNRGVLG